MVLSEKYKNAFTETNKILKNLNKKDYNKIPNDVIVAIENNQNKNYIFELNNDLDLSKQELMPETRALLFNIFRDYFATDTQKDRMKKHQQKERERINEIKKKMYSDDLFYNKSEIKDENIKSEKQSLICQEKKSTIKKIIDKIKNILFRKKNV